LCNHTSNTKPQMGERKVISKHYPIDFDPADVLRRNNPKNAQIKVRVMLPMSIRCLTCGEYIYRGKKFNARKETVSGETYIGIKIYRFYVRCTRCSNEITFKTDPKRADYVSEHGAVRINNFLQENEIVMEKMKQIRLQEEQGKSFKPHSAVNS
jgi:ribosomal protein S27E